MTSIQSNYLEMGLRTDKADRRGGRVQHIGHLLHIYFVYFPYKKKSWPIGAHSPCLMSCNDLQTLTQAQGGGTQHNFYGLVQKVEFVLAAFFFFF